jgi:hypothetical protein
MLLRNLFQRPGALQIACALTASIGIGCSSEPAPTPKPTGAEMDVLRYELKGDYDWARGRLVATVDITLTPADDGSRTVVLDSAVAEIKAVRLSGGGALPFTTDAAAKELRVNIASAPEAPSGQALTLSIDYEAEPSDSLLAVVGRKGDPLKDIRAVFTHSEPLGAELWMPCHDTPADRAIFSVDMGMASAEMMIANGDLVDDKPGEGGSRRMKYQTAYTLPTYLMAFAISDFEVESATAGSVPVSIWHRRGLPGEYGPVLDELAGMISHFEALLGPYPFEKYALVHVPMLPGTAIENAGITFQIEGVGSAAVSGELAISAHELAHQWTGDLMTIKSWDDLWVKEGMATLLQSEGVRVHSDKDGPLTLNGDDFYAVEGEPIRDTSLAPKEKYSSGPYGRAAWLMTQVRCLLGEETFWKTLRGILEQHRFQAIGTEEFIEGFAEALGPEVTARVRHAVDAKGVPVVEVMPTPSGSATVTVRDPDGALVAPIDIGWVAEDGSVRKETLTVGEPLEIAPKQSGEFLLLDPVDCHPPLDWFIVDDGSMEAFYTSVDPLRSPTSPAAINAFLDIGSAHQDPVLWSALPNVSPEAFKAFVADLDAESTRAIALPAACRAAGDPGLDPQTAAAWDSLLEELLLVPPTLFAVDLIGNGRYSACTMFDPVTAFADEWAKLQTGLPSGGVDYTRLTYLSAFELPAPFAMSTWGSVAKQANSAHTRALATLRLRFYAGKLDPADVPVFRAFFVEQLSASEDIFVLLHSIRALVAMAAPTAAENADALAGLTVVLHSPWTRSVHRTAVCSAFKLTKGDAAAWQAFIDGQDSALLETRAAERLQNPTLCP